MLVSLEKVTKRYGQLEVLKGVDWQINDGERWALVGPNGSGKTTILKMLAGADEYDSGEMKRAKGLKISTVPQVDLAGSATPSMVYLTGAFYDIQEKEAELDRLRHRASDGDHSTELLHRISDLQDWLFHNGGYTYEAEAQKAFFGMGFTEADAARSCGSFSGGEQMRLKLTRAILDPSDLLLLDEPGNHLDESQRAWLAGFLAECKRSTVIVTHDPEILEGAIDHVAYLLDGRVYTFRGDFASFEVQFEEMQKSRGRAYEQQQAFIARTEEFIRRYKAGQRTRQARGREKVLARMDRLEAPLRTPEGFKLRLKFDAITGEDVLQVKDLKLDLGSKSLHAENLGIQRGWKIGLVGPNGCGKTTLLRAMCGEIPGVKGSIRWGTNVRLAHYDQHQRRLPHGKTLFQTIANLLPEGGREDVMNHLGAFGFGGHRADQGVENLSGGERARLHLLAVLLAKANVLFLDEPTNHLDRTAVEALKDALMEFQGSIVLVSHEEDFLKVIVDHTWAVSGLEVITAAGFSPELAAQKERVAAPAEPVSPESGAEKPLDKIQPERKSGLSKNERYRLTVRLGEVESRLSELSGEKSRIESVFANPDSVVTHDWKTLQLKYEETKREIAEMEGEWLEITEALG